ncbi:MAG: GNAT family N-acetyltransferase, partial [Ktedonobacterales bacterium]
AIRLTHRMEQPAVAACVRAAYAPYIARIGKEPAPMSADYASLIERGVVSVLPDDEGVRGVLVMELVDGALFIENVAVHPRYQGHGLGRRLMAYAEARARTRGSNEIRLYTNERMTENLAFYARLGFEEVDRRMDAGYRRVFLRKTLS